MIDRAVARIDLSALNHNCHIVRQLVGSREIMAMIKADAYGHGLLRVAQALKAADSLGVATVEEAVCLREQGIHTPILVMTGFSTIEECRLFFQYHLSPVIHHALQIELLEKIRVNHLISVWLKIDTGMHRLGFSTQNFKTIYEQLLAIRIIQKPIHLMTHLADADNVDREFTQFQLNLFNKITHDLPGRKSICNSAALLTYPEALADVVRPGILLYGASPFSDRFASHFNLKPVMDLKSKIISIQSLKKGDCVGYGGVWKCEEDMRVGIVGIGYGDGYSRHVQMGTPVLIGGIQCPIVGRISMDMLSVDLRQQPHAQIGDDVILWGHELPIELIAKCANTIPYELLCQLTERVKFVYL